MFHKLKIIDISHCNTINDGVRWTPNTYLFSLQFYRIPPYHNLPDPPRSTVCLRWNWRGSPRWKWNVAWHPLQVQYRLIGYDRYGSWFSWKDRLSWIRWPFLCSPPRVSSDHCKIILKTTLHSSFYWKCWCNPSAMWTCAWSWHSMRYQIPIDPFQGTTRVSDGSDSSPPTGRMWARWASDLWSSVTVVCILIVWIL